MCFVREERGRNLLSKLELLNSGESFELGNIFLGFKNIVS